MKVCKSEEREENGRERKRDRDKELAAENLLRGRTLHPSCFWSMRIIDGVTLMHSRKWMAIRITKLSARGGKNKPRRGKRRIGCMNMGSHGEEEMQTKGIRKTGDGRTHSGMDGQVLGKVKLDTKDRAVEN